jgi:MspA
MLVRIAATAVVSLLVLFGTASHAWAEPDVAAPAPAPAEGIAPPPPPEGAIPSAEPSLLATSDGWNLKASGGNETLLPVAPLTTAVTSREYLAGGTFSGAADGAGKTTLTGGTLEAGYRIGCGALLDTVDLNGAVGFAPILAAAGVPGLNYPTINGAVRLHLKPGIVNIVPVDKKSFKGNGARINISGFRIKIDGCAGQSFIQSYATLSSSTETTEDITTYLGTVKVV